MFPVVKDDSGSIRFVVGVIDEQAKRVFQIGYVQIIIREIGRKTAVAVQNVILTFLAPWIIGNNIQFLKLGFYFRRNSIKAPGLPVPIDNIQKTKKNIFYQKF